LLGIKIITQVSQKSKVRMLSTSNELHIALVAIGCFKLGTLTKKIYLTLLHHISSKAAFG
tara:strand:+ start:795 stop:974 length:180 start_codon:yes stop_codon:yes gene_type:complete